MSKGKTTSKNNLATRKQAREFLFNGQKIKPVKLIMENSTFLAAEYESGDLVLGSNGKPMPWGVVSN
jgi:hypothetical protein